MQQQLLHNFDSTAAIDTLSVMKKIFAALIVSLALVIYLTSHLLITNSSQSATNKEALSINKNISAAPSQNAALNDHTSMSDSITDDEVDVEGVELFWGTIEFPLSRLIDTAQREVTVAVPGLYSSLGERVYNSLISAANRNVSVRILSGWSEVPDESMVMKLSAEENISIRFWDISSLGDDPLQGSFSSFYVITDNNEAFAGAAQHFIDSAVLEPLIKDTAPCGIVIDGNVNEKAVSMLIDLFESDWLTASGHRPEMSDNSYHETEQERTNKPIEIMITGPDELFYPVDIIKFEADQFEVKKHLQSEKNINPFIRMKNNTVLWGVNEQMLEKGLEDRMMAVKFSSRIISGELSIWQNQKAE